MGTFKRQQWRSGLVMLIVAAVTGCGVPHFQTVAEDPADLPLPNASAEEVRHFREGDALFELPYRPVDGLGPYFIRDSCKACHTEGGRGPGFVEKMSIVSDDGYSMAADQSLLGYGHTIRRQRTITSDPAMDVPRSSNVKLSERIGVTLWGRGMIEAISDDDILAQEASQAAGIDGVSGRVNRVTYQSEANPDSLFTHYAKGTTNLIGRFGLKARVATLDDFTADAFQGDMGMTSPMRPDEPKNPANAADDALAGPDVPLSTVNAISNYVRLLAIPKRASPTGPGEALFANAGCGTCHVSSWKTKATSPFPALAAIDAPIFSDLLLHDMGPALADGIDEYAATSREWRTTPLIGLRFSKTFMHDGRAHTVTEAITAHGGAESEALSSTTKFQSLSAADQQALITFVESL